jgi:DNA-binding transcriptional LysR family regulator
VLRPSAPLRWEQLFTDDLVCVVDRDHPVRDRFTLEDYAAARHVVVTVIGQEQPMIERWLQARGRSRTAAVRVAFFGAVFAALPGTALVATIPRRLMGSRTGADPRLRSVEPPDGLEPFPYGMVWHPRLESDPAHRWLRDMIRAAAPDLASTR